MKEKPCRVEVPYTLKCLPGGMLVTVRLMLAGPDACVPKGSSSHSNSSTKSFWNTGLEHWGTQGQPGVTQPWLHAHHKSVSSEPGNGLSTHAFLQCRQDLVHEPIGHMQVQERTDMSPQTQSSQSHCSLPHTSWPSISRR